jgi:hypothetical protein
MYTLVYVLHNLQVSFIQTSSCLFDKFIICVSMSHRARLPEVLPLPEWWLDWVDSDRMTCMKPHERCIPKISGVAPQG